MYVSVHSPMSKSISFGIFLAEPPTKHIHIILLLPNILNYEFSIKEIVFVFPNGSFAEIYIYFGHTIKKKKNWIHNLPFFFAPDVCKCVKVCQKFVLPS